MSEDPENDMARGYARSRQRNEMVRAGLTPLGDERPLGLKLAVALALVIAVANLVGAAVGVGDQKPLLGVAFAAIMLAAALGMWRRNYLTILAFEALLAVGIIYAALSLLLASSILGVVVALAVIAVCSPIFWLLVRVMARLQVPPR